MIEDKKQHYCEEFEWTKFGIYSALDSLSQKATGRSFHLQKGQY